MKRIIALLVSVAMFIGQMPATALTVEPPAAELEGKKISILGASISTYTGISNNAGDNATIGDNAVYYTAGRHGVYAEDTWWMQAVNDLGLELLVNNSWSGSSLLYERNGTAGAYEDRCVQLHNQEGEEPDIIAIQMGTNDFQYYKETLGNANIDYDTLIASNEDGSYTYASPATSLEAAAIVLHKISVRYPKAEVYYLNISQRVDGTDALIQSFNAELKQVVEHFGAHIVDIYGSAITMENFDTYIGDGRVHPNKLGMDAYTEAFKRSVIANTDYSIDTHKVTLNLDGVTADYGDHKIVKSGDAFGVKLMATDRLSVIVTMGGADITDEVYTNGAVHIAAVTNDVTITATTKVKPQKWRWEFDGADLSCTVGNNTLTKHSGTTADGVFANTRYALAWEVVLKHDLSWTVEWKCEGTFQNTGGSSGARIFTSDNVNANYNARYIFKSNKNGLIAMGEKTSTGSHNYGIALGDYGIDWTALHTYRLENRIAADGSNMVWLYVDGEEIGPMNHYYIGTTDKAATSDWLSGKDFVFPYMGTDTHGFTNASIEYIQVTECDHVYENGICTVCGAEHPNLANYEGKVISILGDSISTFAGYIPVADGFNLEHLPRYPQADLLTDVEETWWMQVIAKLDAKLGINDSWRGATCSGAHPVTTGTTGANAAMGNLQRIANLGANGTPDIILFYGGTNDLAHVSKVGTFDPQTAPTQVDLTTKQWDNLADGYVHTLLRLKHFYPDATIVAMLPTYTASYYSNDKLAAGNEVLAQICQHYGIICVDLRDCGISTKDLPDGIHPNAAGMDYITGAVLDALLNQCEMEAGENTVHSVKHELSNVKSSLGYFKGVSDGMPFEATLTGEEMQVRVEMDGVDVTEQVYRDGVIRIESVTGDLRIVASGRVKPVYEGHLQELGKNVCADTNLWTLLDHDEQYYAESGWMVHSSGKVYSVTIPVSSGDRIWATSIQGSGANGGTIRGIRVTWFLKDGTVMSMNPDKVYQQWQEDGYLTAPEGAVAVCIPMWNVSDSNALYLLGRDHVYENGICAGCGAVLGDLDADGDVDAEDLTILARHVAGIAPLTDKTALANGDVDGNGTVDAEDLTIHARFVAGIILTFPEAKGAP